MVEQAIQQGRGHDLIAKDLGPLTESAVGGEDHRGALVASVDQLEEEIAAIGADREISDFIDDQQCVTRGKRTRSRTVPSRSARASEAIRSARVAK